MNSNKFTELQIKANLQSSGSLVAKARETNVFQAALDDPSTGYIFAPSKKQMYDVEQIKKSLDIDVTQLITGDQTQLINLIPRPIYDDALNALDIATETIATQSAVISDLSATASAIQSDINSINSNIDNQKLQIVITQGTILLNNQQLKLINDNANSSLERTVLDGIESTALTASISGLTGQVVALKNEETKFRNLIAVIQRLTELKNAEIVKGAKNSKYLTGLSIKNPADIFNNELTPITDIYYRIFYKDAYSLGQWHGGPEIDILNFDVIDHKIEIDNTPDVGVHDTGTGWIDIKSLVVKFPGKDYTPMLNATALIKSGEKVTVKLALSQNFIDNKTPNSNNKGDGHTSRIGGTIKIFGGGFGTGRVELKTVLDKYV